ncbi:MAG: NADH-quinone oxidoreductase subunit H [Planctomycetes bacterium]|nr:NADH-quinone oxidoreductase subunit H [Planctomycetota bacterium]
MDGFGWLFLKAALPWLVLLQMIPVMIFLERKGSALIADRVGPNRTFIPGLGLRLAGMVQNFADVVKLLTKEEFIPNHVNRRLYLIAPMLSLFIALMVGSVIPFTPIMALEAGDYQIQGISANIGLLFVLGISSVGVYAVTLAGWASNNKYALMGALRASAQMISYELSMGLAVVGLFMVFGNASLGSMVESQSGTWLAILPRWGVFLQPIGFVLFLIAGFAETNRNPFDLAEGESEIVGFHVEYGGVKFALFFMAEYIHIVVISLLLATCYFGGYQLPWVSAQTLADPGTAATVAKLLLVGTIIVACVIGLQLIKWHLTNRKVWKDSRRNEGVVLSVLFGWAPALTALLVFIFWDGDFARDGGAILGGLIGFLTLMVKTLFFCWLFVWVRWTLPRFRYDQLMALGWKLLVPVGLANILLTGVLIKLGIW